MDFIANFSIQLVLCFIIGTIVYIGLKLVKLVEKPETKPQFISLLIHNFLWFSAITSVIVLLQDTPIDAMYIVKFFGALVGFALAEFYTKTKNFNEE